MTDINIQTSKGFTLIELVIAVFIVGILVAVAVPGYNDHVRRGYRADAQSALMEAAILMEKHRTIRNTYAGALANDVFKGQVTIPPNSTAATQQYALSIAAQGAGTFTLRATPFNNQLNDECGTMSLEASGARSADEDECWN